MSTINSLSSPTQQPSQEAIDRTLIAIRPDLPFGDMALALSGGGFRAAAFSLGAISYLNHCWLESEEDTLLKHVTFITSTSGGTITNAGYSSSLFKPGFVFNNFYQKMKNFMNGDSLLKEVFSIISDPSKWNETAQPSTLKGNGATKEKVKKSHNFINAFAKAYDQMSFHDPAFPTGNLFDVYFDRSSNPHLKTVCFNATELNNGISFRFQTNGDPSSIRTVGNYYLQFNDAIVARKLKLGDLVATSSCFPSGLEPMIYPNDFVHPELNNIDEMYKAINYKNNNPLELNEIINKPFCMVDGGVVDNQGLYSMMMEDTFRAENPPKKQFDLMIVCDVGSYFVKAFTTPEKNESWWANMNFSMIKRLMPLGTILFIISLLLSILTNHILRRIGLTFLLASGLYTILYFYAVGIFNKEKNSLSSTSIGKVLIKQLGFFSKLRFNALQQMLAARINSTILIATDLFLKQERRQYYNEFYNMPAYKDRALSCLIYEFSAQHDTVRKENLGDKDKAWWPNLSGDLSPSSAMQQIATNATSMGTTLWFDTGNQTMRDNIIACGQFTMCYNLLKHIYRLEILNQKWKDDNKLQDLKNRLKKDWGLFLSNPAFMV